MMDGTAKKGRIGGTGRAIRKCSRRVAQDISAHCALPAAMPPYAEKGQVAAMYERSLSSPPSIGVPSETPTRPEQKWAYQFGGRTRYVILIIVTICVSSIWSNILTFNFTIICMSPKKLMSNDLDLDGGDEVARILSVSERDSGNSTIIEMNDPTGRSASSRTTVPVTRSEYDYSATEKNLIIGAVAVGALLAAVPITYLINHFGPRKVFSVVGFVSAVATAFIPMAASVGLPYFLSLRVIQGVAFAACFPVIGGVIAKWASFKQNAIFLAIMTGFLQLAPSYTMSVSGHMCEMVGWPSVYYLHATNCIIVFTVFALFFRDTPRKHPGVGESELQKLFEGKPKLTSSKKALKQVPYAAILKTVGVWAVWVAAFGHFSIVNLVMLFSPTYFHRVMNYEVAHTGLSAALPPFIQFFVKVFSGITSDKVRCFPEKIKLRVYNSIAFFGTATFFIPLFFVPSSEPLLALVFLTIGTSVLGFDTGGFYKSATLVARDYSQFVMGIMSMIISVAMLIVPLVVESITEHHTDTEWRFVFLVFAGIMIVTNAVFCIFASGEAAEWARDAELEEQNIGWAIDMRRNSIPVQMRLQQFSAQTRPVSIY